MRPSSPLLDSVRDLFEGQEQLAKDFTRAFAHLDGKFPEEPKTKSTATTMSKMMGDKLKKSSFRSKKHNAPPHLQNLKKFDAESFDSPYTKNLASAELLQNTGSYEVLTQNLYDVIFMVGQGKNKTKLLGVRAILGVRSR